METMLNTIMADEVCRLMQRRLAELGVADHDGQTIANHLTQTSLNGIDTHGIRLFDCYDKELAYGRATPQPQWKMVRESMVTGVLDADAANGVLAGHYAMQKAIDKAKLAGLGLIVVKNSNHYGAASNFTRMAVAQNLIGLSMTNSDALVALQGSETPFLGTNPIALSVPCASGEEFHLDFATSQMAYSKVKHYQEQGIPLPKGWAIDESGQDSSLSNLVTALQPLGGYKGQGLSMMVQMLTCVLSNSPFDHQLSHLYVEPYDSPRQVAHFFLAIDPDAFMDKAEFAQQASRLIEQAREHAPKAILPGDKERAARTQRRKQGIPLGSKEAAYFSELLAKSLL
jgi:LDH2 family malate/lactate/ureidoglycolate dehydrogenase